MDPRRLLPALAVVTVALVLTTLVVALVSGIGRDGRDADASEAAPRSGVTAVAGSPAAVLAAWDARRARAWSRGDAASLRALYVAGSAAGAADVRLLRRYAARGLRVEGLQTQVLDLEVLEETPDRLRLLVTDRLVGGLAVGRGARARLPRDRPTTRQVVLVRAGRTWLVRSVGERR